MYSTCLHCTKSLGTNQVLETLPIGRRVAFDADKGRLWVVCRDCARWNLVPFDTRLESIDACERLYRDTPTRYATDNIGLARTKEGLELVRIGAPLRPEFASWRYGEQYKRRRRQGLILGGTGAAVAAVGIGTIGVGIGGAVMAGAVGGMLWDLGWLGWRAALAHRHRVRVPDPVAADRVLAYGLRDAEGASLVWRDDGPTLEVPRPWPYGELAGIPTWTGQAVRTVGRRLLGSVNLLSGSHRDLAHATERLASANGDLWPWLSAEAANATRGDPRRVSSPVFASRATEYYRDLDVPKLRFGALSRGDRLAVEMWLSEDVERSWLEGELKLLEREWREAERLGKIADDLLLTQETRDT